MIRCVTCERKCQRNLCSSEMLSVADGYHPFLMLQIYINNARMNVWKGLCMGKMCLLIYQLRKEPTCMLYQCLAASMAKKQTLTFACWHHTI